MKIFKKLTAIMLVRTKRNVCNSGFVLLVKSVICFTLCAFQFNGMAQTEVKSGYVIATSADTLKGYLHDEIDKKMVSSIRLSGEKKSRPKEYTTVNALAFGSGNRIFRRFKLTDSSFQFGKLANSGKLTLLVSHEKKRTIYFIENSVTGKTAVLQPPKVTDSSFVNSATVVVKFLYLNQMLTVADLPQELSVIKKIPYREKFIRQFVTDYNQKSDPTTAKVYNDSILRHGTLFGGVNFSPKGYYENGYSFGFLYGKQNRDLNRKGYAKYGIRYTWVTFAPTSTRSNIREDVIDFLPWGYQYSLGVKRLKPYAMTLVGLSYVRSRAYDPFTLNYSTSSMFIPVLTLGGGLLVGVGKGNLLIEANVDAPFFLGQSAGRLIIGYDIVW